MTNVHSFFRYVTLFISITMFIGIFTPMRVSAQNDIDAKSSASNRLQLKSGKAYSSYAVITWQDYYSNGTEHTLKWGTTNAFGNQMDLKPFNARTDVTDTIKDLSPDTKYFAQFYRLYRGRVYTTDFQFTTAKSTATAPAVSAAGPVVTEQPGAVVALYSTAGKKIAVVPVSGRSLHAVATIAAPGLYLARVEDIRGRQLRTFQIVVHR
jgi:hypothetical protein